MGYHVEDSHIDFNELPERILMREDGYLGAYKFYGEPIVDYWYVPEQRVDELRELVQDLWKYIYIGTAQDGQSLHDRTHELGIEVNT